jgi:hypothetical protein
MNKVSGVNKSAPKMASVRPMVAWLRLGCHAPRLCLGLIMLTLPVGNNSLRGDRRRSAERIQEPECQCRAIWVIIQKYVGLGI